MQSRQALSYDDRGILHLDEWDVAEDDPGAWPGRAGVRSTALGHLDDPRTRFKVPGPLAASYDALAAHWALEGDHFPRAQEMVPD